MWLLAALVVLGLVLLTFFAKHGLLGKALWWVAKHLVLANYRAGVWLTEHILLRFPLALLPTLAPGLVKLACAVLLPSLVAFIVLLVSRESVSASVYLVTSAPLLVVLVVGTYGKWRFRQTERKGLAHV